MKTLNKYNGVYAGLVVGTRDPLSRGRVRVQIPQILGTTSSAWADPMGGVNTPPALGDRVNIQFLGGDVTRPAFSTYDVTRPWETSLEAIQETLIEITSYPTAWTPLLTDSTAYNWRSDLGYEPAWRWEREGGVEMRGTFERSAGGPGYISQNAVIINVPSAIVPAQYAYGLGASGMVSGVTADHVRLEVLPTDVPTGTPGDLVVRYPTYSPAYNVTWVALDGFRYDIV